MIKTYRNGLLAAAIALMATGCGGDSAEDPLQDPNLGENAGNGDPATLQGIADLMGGLLLEVMGTSSTLFDTFSIVSDSNTSIGKLLNNTSADSAAPVGVNTVVGATCSGDPLYNATNTDPKSFNYFELAVVLEIADKDDPSKLTTPAFDGLEELATGNLQTNLDMRFRTCNESEHTYDDDPLTPTVEEGAVRVLDGNMTVVLSTETNITGEPTNDKDFDLTGKVTMDNYFVQTDLAKKPDVVSGNFNISLVTDNVDEANYSSYIYGSITTNDAELNGSNTIDFTADGQLGLGEDADGNITVDSYNVSLKGNVTSTIPDSAGSYRLFTDTGGIQKLDNGVSDDDIYPTSGKIGIIDQNTKYIHYANADADGLKFDLQEDDGTRREVSCTWDQINDDDCDVNAQ